MRALYPASKLFWCENMIHERREIWINLTRVHKRTQATHAERELCAHECVYVCVCCVCVMEEQIRRLHAREFLRVRNAFLCYCCFFFLCGVKEMWEESIRILMKIAWSLIKLARFFRLWCLLRRKARSLSSQTIVSFLEMVTIHEGE